MKENKKERNSLGIWWIGGFPYNVAWMHAAISEKPESMDNGLPSLFLSSADTVKKNKTR